MTLDSDPFSEVLVVYGISYTWSVYHYTTHIR